VERAVAWMVQAKSENSVAMMQTCLTNLARSMLGWRHANRSRGKRKQNVSLSIVVQALLSRKESGSRGGGCSAVCNVCQRKSHKQRGQRACGTFGCRGSRIHVSSIYASCHWMSRSDGLVPLL
jgi:hypothetical protein